MNLNNKSVIRKGLLELLNNKSMLNLFFFGIVLLDGLGSILPQYFNRQVTIFIPLPVVLLLYFINVSNKNKLFIVSLIFHFLGICYFNAPYEEFNSMGIIFHTIGFFIYYIILFKYYGIINTKKLLAIYIIVLILIIVPSLFFSKGMQERMLFSSLLFYIVSVILFIVSSLVLYFNKKSKINRFLLFSVISIFLSSYSQGYNLFMENTNYLVTVAIVFFNFTHYFMCWFLVGKPKEKLIIN